ncbi:hypothetical protein ABVK25_012303 [Lepraria finkii]|uniref:Uncharacterized protein n=1 Tax=Lepraria finkii TaxID=1340010 RepID=A0ABR4AHR1_9LECA
MLWLIASNYSWHHTDLCIQNPSIEKATKAKRAVDTADLVSSEIEKAGNAKRTVDGAFIITPIEKATKDKRTVDASELVSSDIKKAGNKMTFMVV